jgi:hypothetical protein
MKKLSIIPNQNDTLFLLIITKCKHFMLVEQDPDVSNEYHIQNQLTQCQYKEDSKKAKTLCIKGLAFVHFLSIMHEFT